MEWDTSLKGDCLSNSIGSDFMDGRPRVLMPDVSIPQPEVQGYVSVSVMDSPTGLFEFQDVAV